MSCADGECGESIAAVIGRAYLCVTHIVVKVTEPGFPAPDQRLVEVERVQASSPDSVQLNFAKADLAATPPFTSTRWTKTTVVVPQPYGYVDASTMPYANVVEDVDVPVEEELVPAGELVVHWDTIVRTTDREVGSIAQLILEPSDNRVTHFVLAQSHLLGAQEAITLPLAAVDRLEGGALHLKLDERALASLPRIPYLTTDQKAAGKRVELVAKIYDDTAGAAAGLKQVKDLHRANTLKLINAAVLIKEADGKTSFKDDRDLDPGRSRLAGAIAGGLVGLVAGPVGAIVGAAVGLGAGQAAASAIDKGLPDNFLKALQEKVESWDLRSRRSGGEPVDRRAGRCPGRPKGSSPAAATDRRNGCDFPRLWGFDSGERRLNLGGIVRPP